MATDYDATAKRRRKLCDPFGQDAFSVVLQEGEHVAATAGKSVMAIRIPEKCTAFILALDRRAWSCGTTSASTARSTSS